MPDDALPPLVRAYAERAVPSGPTAAPRVRIEQDRQMVLKPGGASRRFTAVEDLASDRVMFSWRARFPLGLRVTDAYDGRDGLLEVRLLGLPIQRRRGQELARGEAFRYLAEIPGSRTRSAPTRRSSGGRSMRAAWRSRLGPQAAWSPCYSPSTSTATSCRPLPSARGSMPPARWPRGSAPTATTATWAGCAPARGAVRWELSERPFTYWRGSVKSLELA